MICRLNYLCMAFFVLLPSLLVAYDAVKKNPPPDPAALKDAIKLVNDAFKDDFAAAKTPEQKVTLAKKLLDATKEEKDVVARFALLSKTRDVASEAGDLGDAIVAIDKMDSEFNIDALKMKAESATSAAKSARSPDDRKNLATQLGGVIANAVAADRYDIGRSLAEIALATARAANDADLTRQAATDMQQVREAETAYADVKKLVLVLADKPADPDANLKVGKFRCFVKGDWQGGLPMLALGSDAALKALAEKEVAGVTGADNQVKLGDAWWDVTDKMTGGTKNGAQAHAAKWYRDALPSMEKGLARVRVENRITEVQRHPSSNAESGPALAATGTPIILMGVQKDDVVKLSATQLPHRLKGEYKVVAGQQLVIESGATIICDPNSVIVISGTIEVGGTAEKPVVFRGARSALGSWKGIALESVEKATAKYLRVSDAENGVKMTKSKATFIGCVFAGNQTGLYAGDYGSDSHPSLSDCVLSLNSKHGLALSGSSATLDSCTISRNGEWGIDGTYYASPALTKCVVSANKSGGINCRIYECKVSASGCILVGNGSVDIKNGSSLEWDLRGNYWGTVLTKALKANSGTVSSPSIIGKVRLDGFLEDIPKECGASTTSLAGQKLW